MNTTPPRLLHGCKPIGDAVNVSAYGSVLSRYFDRARLKLDAGRLVAGKQALAVPEHLPEQTGIGPPNADEGDVDRPVDGGLQRLRKVDDPAQCVVIILSY